MKLCLVNVILVSLVILYMAVDSQAADCSGTRQTYTASIATTCSRSVRRWWARRTTYSACYKSQTFTRLVPTGCSSKGCGGCSSSSGATQRACTVSVAEKVTKSGTGSCSYRVRRRRWFRRSRRTEYKSCTKVVYFTKNVDRKACCVGYRLVGDTCFEATSDQCGTRAVTLAKREAPVARKKADGTTFIVGGTNAVYGQFPWQVSLTTTFGGHFCGGTLLNEHFVLTAAHCLTGRTTAQYRVILGEHIRGSPDSHQVTATIAAHRLHPDYNTGTSAHDIALIRLTNVVTENAHVRRACLPTSTSDRVAVGTETEISGWGVTTAGRITSSSTAATTLQFAVVQVASEQSCSNVFSNYISSNMICVTDGMGDRVISGCYGDSGGPLMVTRSSKTTVVGVTSYGSNVGCAMGRPVVYTEVAAYLGWIRSTILNM